MQVNSMKPILNCPVADGGGRRVFIALEFYIIITIVIIIVGGGVFSGHRKRDISNYSNSIHNELKANRYRLHARRRERIAAAGAQFYETGVNNSAAMQSV